MNPKLLLLEYSNMKINQRRSVCDVTLSNRSHVNFIDRIHLSYNIIVATLYLNLEILCLNQLAVFLFCIVLGSLISKAVFGCINAHVLVVIEVDDLLNGKFRCAFLENKFNVGMRAVDRGESN